MTENETLEQEAAVAAEEAMLDAMLDDLYLQRTFHLDEVTRLTWDFYGEYDD